MIQKANNTLLLDEPVARPTPPPAVTDQTKYMTRIIRRALRNPGSDTPLSQAIRAAVARATPQGPVSASDDEAIRIRQVALRMDALMAQHVAASPARSPHLDTVRH